MDDHSLIAGYLKGDDHALPLLIDRHLRPVYNFVARLVGNSEDAEDITQEVFVKVWRGLGRFDPSKNFRTWLFTIARNTAIDWMRKKRSVPFSHFEDEEGDNPFIEGLADTGPRPDELAAHAGQKDFLDQALRRLPPAMREVIVLHDQEDLTFDQIGKVLGKPLDTVKSRHRRGMMELRKILDAPK